MDIEAVYLSVSPFTCLLVVCVSMERNIHICYLVSIFCTLWPPVMAECSHNIIKRATHSIYRTKTKKIIYKITPPPTPAVEPSGQKAADSSQAENTRTPYTCH